jgi:hypothetical protein
LISVRGRALPGVLALTAASGIWLVAEAPPAEAYVCAFNVQSPGEGSISGSPTVPFRGDFEVKHGLAERVLEVTFTSAPGPLPPPTVSRRTALEPAGDYDVAVGPLSLNGAYTARVRAIHTGTSPLLNCDDGLGPERRDTEASAVVRFKVSVPASPPRNVTARFDPGARRATVTWERSGDPDIVGYTIIKQVGTAPATGVPVAADPLAWTDTNLPSGGGTIRYSVQAFRQGPDPGTTSLPSAPVAAAPLAVPAAPAPGPSPSTTTGGTRGPSTPGGATSTTVPFAFGPAVGGDTPPARAVPFLPFGELRFPESTAPATEGQGGYQPLIPYSPGGREDTQPFDSDSDDQAVAGRRSSSDEPGDGTPGLAYVASALLSTVVAAHILWLRRQALRPQAAGAAGHHELETVASDPEPAPRPPPSAEGDSAFEPVPDDTAMDEAEVPDAVGARQPLRAVREPAMAAAAAGAILGAHDGSGTVEPVTPLPRSKATRPRPIVVPVPAGARHVRSTAGRRPDDETPGAEPEVRIAPAARPASGGPREAGSRPRRRRDATGGRREAPRRPKLPEEVVEDDVATALLEEPADAGGIVAVDPPRSVEPPEVAGSDAPAVAPAEPEARPIGNGRPAVRLVLTPRPEGEAEDTSDSQDQPERGDLSAEPVEEAAARAAVKEMEPVGSGAPALLEAAAAERSVPNAAPADPPKSLAPATATADDVEESPIGRARLRSRLGRSRTRSTPWVSAEPVEPPKPVDPLAGEALDPDRHVSSGAAARTPASLPTERAAHPEIGDPGRGSRADATGDPGTGDPGPGSAVGATGDPVTGDPGRESRVGATGDPGTGDPGPGSLAGATGDPGTGGPGRESLVGASGGSGRGSLVGVTGDPGTGDPGRGSLVGATGDPLVGATGDPGTGGPGSGSQVGATGDGGKAPSEAAQERPEKRPVLILRPKGSKPS